MTDDQFKALLAAVRHLRLGFAAVAVAILVHATIALRGTNLMTEALVVLAKATLAQQ